MAIKKLLFPLIVVIFSLVLSVNYFRPGLPVQDDGIFMVLRSTAFHQSIKDGHFPVRWVSQLNEGYGYPVMNFLYPLPFYLAEPFIFAGLSPLQATKTLFILTTAVSGLAMYVWIRFKSSNDFAALVASLVYLFLPYRLIDLYMRGSLGENLGFAILPFIFLLSDRFFRTKKTTDVLLASCFYAALVLAHNSFALLLSPVILGYWLLYLKEKQTNIYQLFVFILTALSLSAFFWIPALYDLQFTRASQIEISQISNYFVPVYKMLEQQGWLAFLILLVSLIAYRNKKTLFFSSFFLIALFLQFSFAQPLWHALPLDRLVQFPFRFAAITTFSTAAVTGLIFSSAKDIFFSRKIILLGLALTIGWHTWLLKDIQITPITQDFFDTNFHTSTTKDEFTPVDVIERPETVAETEFEIIAGRTDAAVINIQEFKTQEKYLQLVLEDKVEVVFNTHYFPGWNVFIDDNEAEFEVDPQGRIRVEVTQPERVSKIRDVKLVWLETPLRNRANLISLLSVLLVSFILLQSKFKDAKKTISVLSLLFILITLGSHLITRSGQITQKFDPVEMEQKYLNSQWVNPDSKAPLGDSGLYTWAGWRYVHGENPILINSEMPPLGKYIIGLGLLVTNRPGLVGLGLSLFLLSSLYLLSKQILNHWLYAVIPVALFVWEDIFISSLTTTMLDQIQVGFLTLAFFFLLKTKNNPRNFMWASLCLGGVLSSKFYAGGVLVIISILGYYFFTKQFKRLIQFGFSVPLAGLVHMASYWRFFQLGNSIRDYLGTQKYIYSFYRQGAPSVPFGSYWGLVFLNKWRVWWGPRWGEYYVIPAKEWSLTWPINGLISFSFILNYLWKGFNRWRKAKIDIPEKYLLVNWLLFYSAFLTTIGGWPHYMGLFLPFSNILLVSLFIKGDKDAN